MIKKINKYLLENYPLIWNTRLFWMLIILPLSHLAFYFMGFNSYKDLRELHDWDLFSSYFMKGFVWIGVLLSILIFILWLNQYFKQNAFKSFYPKKNSSLFYEFLILFLISFLNVSFYLSFTEGLRKKISTIETTENIEQQSDLVNKVAVFTLQEVDYNPNYFYDGTYGSKSRCLPAPVFDSLVSKEEVLKLFVLNKVKNKSKYWKDVNPDDYLNYEDSLKIFYYNTIEFETLLAKHFPERSMGLINEEEDQEYEEELMIGDEMDYVVGYATEAPSGEHANYNLQSLYNYCHTDSYVNDKNKTNIYYTKHTHDLLSNNQKDSIEKLLADYLKLADVYDVNYRFEDKKWIDYVYNPPYYFVDKDLRSINNMYAKETITEDYVSHEKMVRTISNLNQSKSNVIPTEGFLALLYIALSCSIMIFTFRVTSLKAWVIALVGSFIIWMVYGAIIFFIGIADFDFMFIDGSLFLAITFILIFWILTFVGIFIRKNKLISGVNLNWLIWSFPAIIPLCVSLYLNWIEYKYSIVENFKYYEDPHYRWIENHWIEILSVNIIVFVVFVFAFIPIIKKWKAMAEE